MALQSDFRVDPYAHEVADKAEIGSVTIDGQRYPAVAVTPINLGRFQSKFTFGDPTVDSDDLISSWIQNSWRGGGQKLQLVEGADEERWWESTVQTEYPEALTLQDKTYTYTLVEGESVFPVGDYNDRFHIAHGESLAYYDPVTDGEEIVGAMTGTPTDFGVVYTGELWIPLGTQGYVRFNGDTASLTTLNDVLPLSFLIWDGRIVAIDTVGRFCVYDQIEGWSIPDTATWEGKRNSLPEEENPRRLVMFHNRSGEPSVHVVTDRGVWSWDENVPRLYPTGLTFPPHPELGLGAASWRTENLYASAGIGVYAYNGTTVAPVGLDRNDGLPARLRGVITSLTPEHNGLIAMVRGAAAPPDTSDDLEAERGLYYDTPPAFAPIAAASSLWKLTTGGWHCLWVNEEPDLPTAVYISIAGGQYDMWWGVGDTLYRRRLRREFHTPEQAAKVGVDHFDPSGYLVTGIYDAGMRGFPKLASHLEVWLDDVFEDGTSTGTVRVTYRTDRDVSWRLLGAVTAPGRTTLPFPTTSVNGIYEGEGFHWIQFRYDLSQPEGVPTLTPVVKSIILKHIKVPLTGRSWDVAMNFGHDTPMFGMSPHQMRETLNAMVTQERFVRFTHQDINTRVLVAQVAGQESTGELPYGNLRVSLLEVLVPDHPVVANP
jgi:hypothetical protein